MSEVVAWGDDGTPRSPRYDDSYRTESGGLAQARHVFLQACGLPAAWAGQRQWRILETGFGLGLNFLAAWQAWRDDPARPGLLHFAAVEAHPVAASDLLLVEPELAPLAAELAERWQGLTPGHHRFSFEEGRVLLTLCVGDAGAMLRELDFAADSVFLDGLEPLRNPAMWELGTLKAVARLCRPGTTLATWTVNGQVRRDLATCGFRVDKVAGLPPKRACLQGRYAPEWDVKGMRAATPLPPSQCVVIGAGLAGAAAAASLARRGWQVTVLDAAPAPAAGASALPAGLLAPHQSPDDNVLSRLSRAGVRITLQACAGLGNEDWQPTGVLEHRMDDARTLPAVEGLEVWSAEARTEQRAAARLSEDTAAWWHASAAWVRPGALVRHWLAQRGVSFRGGCPVHAIEQAGSGWRVCDADGVTLAEAPLVVVAAAHASGPLLAGRITTHPVRGQVSWALHDEAAAAALPSFPVNGHGHFLPRVPTADGLAWFSGSTYGRGDADTRPRAEDQVANRKRLGELLPGLLESLSPAFDEQRVRAWSGVRCTSVDRRPLVGELAPGLWVSTAMGSRGLTFAALCGELIAARLHGEPLPLEKKLAAALDVSRLSKPS
ncbi:FAD-dependent 5-carboxymethylaminomethyl-2-thiouridine(34) oxidoreductase MnmC [Ramlibacter sp. G-1-2-2]|uniref:tRNA 5-methylaminomethyl-2-thiouridine biosynthesis bifunctional protein MnmC n=1 Tax=Ramlibacter agri TaxID=2728837 RepID=A0A848HDI7_9BURK|nr:FAD-dependent 5-carboxymethylaminomethyl-2-thiouridine(34) oxidoreductase MnmC [Ramlibacter agri]